MPADATGRGDPRFSRARAVIAAACRERATPAAVVEVGRRADVLWREAFGRLTYAGDAPACTVGTVFDLASLTKVIATGSIAMRALESGRIALDSPISTRCRAWRGQDRAAVTIRHLLEHASGLPAHVKLFETLSGAAAFEGAIARLPLTAPPGTSAIYSDVGFMLLGFLLERAGGAPFDRQFEELDLGGDEPLTFLPPPALSARTAPTEVDDWRGRLLVGEVHDENAAALGGVAAHAGLFGTAAGVGAFARLVLDTFEAGSRLARRETLLTFAARSAVPGSTRALAWDTMQPTSSCGTLMSARAIGHTGFTGTSLWVDPGRDVYVVLLSNRVHPSREPNTWAPRRAVIHDAILSGLA